MLQSLKTFLLVSGIVLVGMAAGFAQNGNTNHTEFATLGGGCFWCMDAVFKLLPGVKSITSGYAGGHTENPTYDQVSTGDTGHAEVIQIEFDPQKISYDKLLYYFWEAHDPTTLNRQGADTGTQYRSIILYQSEKQKLLAEKSKLEAQKKFHSPIVTEILQGRSSPPGLLREQFRPALQPGGHPAESGENQEGIEEGRSMIGRVTEVFEYEITHCGGWREAVAAKSRVSSALA
jgi:peptide-methionine (S)-S-oxide reductase